MPVTRRGKANAKQDPTEALDMDDILKLSQSSDDAGIMATVVQQIQTTREKKRAEKETKFIKAVQKELDKTLVAKIDECSPIFEEMNTLYENFVMDYAAAEDKIRLIEKELGQECQRLLELMEGTHAAIVQRDKGREKDHIQAMALSRRSCEDFRQMIDNFANLGED